MKHEKEARRIYEMQQKSLHDRASLLAAVEEMKKKGYEKGFKEGFEKGFEEGKREVKQKVAKALLWKGMDIPFIAEITELTAKEIMELKSGIPSFKC